MEGVYWSLGGKRDRTELRGFACCPGCRMDIVRQPQDRRKCPTPWAHEVPYFRENAISATNSQARTHDQRLLLLRDTEELVGAAVHYSTCDAPEGTSAPAIFERRLDAYSTALTVHGRTLSNGEYASRALLRAVVNDITSRHEPEDEVFLTALVAHQNKPSQKCLERYGWQQDTTLDDTYLLYATRLDIVQKIYDVTSAERGTDVIYDSSTPESLSS